MREPIRVGQLSDTHFLEDDADPEGGHGYDISAAFDAVAARFDQHEPFDLVVVTGDVADHGRAEQYEIAFDAFDRLGDAVSVCPGNHDFDEPFRSAIGGSGSSHATRVMEVGGWAFLFVDSSAGTMIEGVQGGLVDPPDQDRLHSNGALGEREAAWVRDACASFDADHVFVWVHHPPAADVPLAADAGYTAEWAALLAGLPSIRGFGAGHTHVPSQYLFDGREVFVAPSLKNNFDLDRNTWLPPGYRTFEFHADGRVTSDVHLVDDERWPRRPFGRALRSLFMGELSYDQLAEIAARRAARSADGA